MSGDDHAKQACAYLRMLLFRPGEYRDRWQRHADHEGDHVAVARVLSPAGTEPAPELVGTVRQALDGTDLSPDLATSFVSAFAVRPRHAKRLFDLLRGSAAVRVISGDVAPPAQLGRPEETRTYETLSLHESHVLGPDGLPAEHQTIQVIRSTVDRLDSLPYRFDTDELAVEVVRGGRVGETVYHVTDTLYAVDILLADPLERGETALMQYRTTFFYKSPPPPEFRRGVLGSTKDLTLWVTFHQDRLPARVWSARWDGVEHAKVIEREPVELDGELSVHNRFDTVERAVVGFYWDWD